ncbi:MAG: hypothetical protein JW720_11690 [Sedimentisphaerales bacterium]|nr:hypothetical protein [Sedimentisphaerales bacterium]
MSERRDEKWLDDLIRGSIDTSEPRFDAEQWKQKYPGEFQALVERRPEQSPAKRSGAVVFRSRIRRVAAAAVLVIAVGLLLAYLGPGEREETGQRAKSPSEMVSVMSLRTAYSRGGMEALAEQCDRAVELLGPSSVSTVELVKELNG